MMKYDRLKKLTEGIPHPSLFLDLESFEKNIQWIKNFSTNKKIRIATKSIRSKEILKLILDQSEIFQGLMAYDLREALWLRSEGFKDIVMGYPTVDIESIKELSRDPSEITLMVDLPQHLEMIQNEAKKFNTMINICVDIDLSLSLPFLHFGVHRSSINNIKKLDFFLQALKKCPNLRLTGLMGYEAQIAGVKDKNSPFIQMLKKVSEKNLKNFRQECVRHINNNGFTLEFVNGGGTGSLLETTQEVVVTEVTIGSGVYAPVLFDFYKDFTLSPALFFSLPVVRMPKSDILTCFGGGYIASGAVEKIKSPTPFLPQGLKLMTFEGAGEVQTPLTYSGEENINLGDPIFFRHAKAGEVCERFDKIFFIKNFELSGYARTYRGEGKTFI